jgi:hypothetical protein
VCPLSVTSTLARDHHQIRFEARHLPGDAAEPARPDHAAGVEVGELNDAQPRELGAHAGELQQTSLDARPELPETATVERQKASALDWTTDAKLQAALTTSSSESANNVRTTTRKIGRRRRRGIRRR